MTKMPKCKLILLVPFFAIGMLASCYGDNRKKSKTQLALNDNANEETIIVPEGIGNCDEVIWNPYIVTSQFDDCMKDASTSEYCALERKVEVKYLWSVKRPLRVHISALFENLDYDAIGAVINHISNSSSLEYVFVSENAKADITVEKYGAKPDGTTDISYVEITEGDCNTCIIIDPAYYPFDRMWCGSERRHSDITIMSSGKEINLAPWAGGNVNLIAFHSPIKFKLEEDSKKIATEINNYIKKSEDGKAVRGSNPLDSAPVLVRNEVILSSVKCLVPSGGDQQQEQSFIIECLVRSPGLFGFSSGKNQIYSEFDIDNPRGKSMVFLDNNMKLECVSQLYEVED